MLHPEYKEYLKLLRQRERLLTRAADRIAIAARDAVGESFYGLIPVFRLLRARRVLLEALSWVARYPNEVVAWGEALVETPEEIEREAEEAFEEDSRLDPFLNRRERDVHVRRCLRDMGEYNDAAFALTHATDIRSEEEREESLDARTDVLQTCWQYVKRIKALTDVLHAVGDWAEQGWYDKWWPASLRQSLEDIARKADEAERIPKVRCAR